MSAIDRLIQINIAIEEEVLIPAPTTTLDFSTITRALTLLKTLVSKFVFLEIFCR